MIPRREILSGLLAAFLSVIIIGGAIILAGAEDRSNQAARQQPPTHTNFPTITIAPITLRPGDPTLTPSLTLPPSATPTALPAAAQCNYPAGWQPYVVQVGDTMNALAQQYGISVETLVQGNCLVGTSLLPQMTIWVPYLPPAPSPPACGRPVGWVTYIVQAGDTLYSISQAFGVRVYDLKLANCLVSDLIRTNQVLFVPNVPTRTPFFSPTPSSTPSLTPSSTLFPSPTASLLPPSATPTATPTPTVSPTGSIPPSATATPTASPSPTVAPPSATATPTTTSTATPEPTITPLPSLTPTFTPTTAP